ncbi:MAG: beta-ketoacyl-ACP synthase II [Spirochaetota bacterium]
MSDRRVVITGIGVVSPIGIGKEAFWSSLVSGKTGISMIESFDTSRIPVKIGGEIKAFDTSPWIDDKKVRRIDRTAFFSIIASKQALKDSGLEYQKEEIAEKLGIIIGTAVGGHKYLLEQDEIVHKKGPMKINMLSALNAFPDACAGQTAIELSLHGPSFAVATACSSGLDAIGIGYAKIQSGEMDYVIAGGSDAPICEAIMAAFCLIKALSTYNESPQTACRPFDATRNGFVMGEGAGLLVLEEYEYAKKRGAHIYAEIVGHAMTCDGFHMTAPPPDGRYAVKAVENALKKAKVTLEEIDSINAHGTSTPLNDKTETLVIKTVFNNQAKKIPVSGIKSMIGHLIGAAGSVELIGSLLGMEKGIVLPTINYRTPDPECDLDYVPNEAREHNVRVVMKNSFGFGGKNSVLVVKKV